MAQIIYISHGGGPMPLLNDSGHSRMISFMKDLPHKLVKPEAILVISAHWEERVPKLISSSHPPLLYDYYGFPEESYNLKYPAPGYPDLADEIKTLLHHQNIPCELETERGFDHGMFVPLMLMYPQGDIPVCQLSLVKNLDPEEHIGIGKALQSLMQKNILIIGSGFSFHNMSAFSFGPEQQEDQKNNQFQDWLIQTITKEETIQAEQLLMHWEKAPHARYCHPREEHLMPLHICSAISENKGSLIFDDYILGKRSVAFLWSQK